MLQEAEELGVAEDVIALARTRVGHGRYERGTDPALAPGVVDCSTLMIWLFAQFGVELPRYARQQYAMAQKIPRKDVRPGDLVFMRGKWHMFDDTNWDSVGHVGIFVTETLVVHARCSDTGIVIMHIDEFDPARNLRFGRIALT